MYLMTFCVPTTVPADFTEVLMTYTSKGYRVLGLAYRHLADLTEDQVGVLDRRRVEVGLDFLGFLIMKNELRPHTLTTMAELQQAGIKTLMITGML